MMLADLGAPQSAKKTLRPIRAGIISAFVLDRVVDSPHVKGSM
jgi:hypothetical protein